MPRLPIVLDFPLPLFEELRLASRAAGLPVRQFAEEAILCTLASRRLPRFQNILPARMPGELKEGK